MDILGFTELERNSLFQIVTAILIFGNISCQQRRNEEQASFTQESFECKLCHLCHFSHLYKPIQWQTEWDICLESNLRI